MSSRTAAGRRPGVCVAPHLRDGGTSPAAAGVSGPVVPLPGRPDDADRPGAGRTVSRCGDGACPESLRSSSCSASMRISPATQKLYSRIGFAQQYQPLDRHDIPAVPAGTGPARPTVPPYPRSEWTIGPCRGCRASMTDSDPGDEHRPGRAARHGHHSVRDVDTVEPAMRLTASPPNHRDRADRKDAAGQ